MKQVYPEAEIRLIQSSGGMFDVTVDGKLVFSKKASRRHAEPGEVLRLIAAGRQSLPRATERGGSGSG